MGYHNSEMLWRDEATERVVQRRSTILSEHETQSVSLDAIGQKTLAEPIAAKQNVPEHNHATMDGFAFDATDEYPLSVVSDEVFPEDEPPSVGSGEVVRIATGAPLPDRANTVLKREEATLEDGRLWGEPIDSGSYTYERGSNLSAGETLFERGERLLPKDAILLGDLGRETVLVYEPFSTTVLATGTEIHDGRTRDLDSNMLVGLVRSWGHDTTYEGTVPDEYDRIKSRIDCLANEYNVVLTTGGTSVGHTDYVIRVLAALSEIEFHRVRIRPGKPIAMATLPDHDAVAFAIPGKPIGAHTSSTFGMRPFFTSETSTSTVYASISHDVDLGPDGFEYAVPVILEGNEDSRKAIPLGHSDSSLKVYNRQFDPSVLSSSTRASRADGVVVTKSALNARETVSVIPYSAIE